MPEREPYDIFLSYSRTDVDVARALASRLRNARLRVFLAEDSLRAGENIHRLIDDAIRNAAVTVALIGPGALSSTWMAAEWRTAASGAMTGQSLLVPVLVGDVDAAEIPQALRQFRAVRGDTHETLENAAIGIERAVIEGGHGPSREPEVATPPAPPISYIETGVGSQILAAIETSIRKQSGPVQVIGLGGAGKTTATAAACRAAADRHETLAWITATTEDAVIRGLAQLARRLGFSQADTPHAELAAAALARLATAQTGWLIVFDDAEGAWPWLERWIPPVSATGTAVVVSRRAMPLCGPVVRVHQLDEASALSIVERRLGTSLDDDSRGAVIKLLGTIGDTTPLSVVLLAGQLRIDHEPINDRVYRLLAALDEPASSDRAGAALGSIVGETFQNLVNLRPVSQRIGHVLAAVRETPVPAVLFHEAADDQFLASNPEEVSQALAELDAHGLIQAMAGAIAVHPIVARVMRSDTGPAEALEFLARSVARRRNVGCADNQELTITTDVARHALTDAFEKVSPDATEAAAQLCLETARVLLNGGDAPGAAALLGQTLEVCERVLGPDHLTTLTARSTLAGALQASGQVEQAVALLEQTLADSDRLLGQDHPSTISTRANLALALQDMGRLEQAVALLEQTLADSNRLLGQDHPSTLNLRGSLAAALQATGQVEQAVALLEQTLAESDRLLGQDHPSSIAARSNLAAALQLAGRTDEATGILTDTLAASERLFGPDDPLTVAVRQNLQFVRSGPGGSG